VSTSSEQFDPYRVWLGIPKAEQPPNHYRLLGVTLFESDPEVIQEGADRQVAHLKTKQTGARVQLSQKLLQQVVAAVGCLLDEKAKAKYDRQLREKLKPVAPITIGERGDELTGKGLWTNKFSLNFTGRFENSLEPHEHRPVVKFTPKLKPTTGAAEATE